MHGDVSPKNILCGPHGPVFLDAECAWYGDPAFDLAFCLNHLLLKCLWTPADRPRSSPPSTRSRTAICAASTWRIADDWRRVRRRLLPALFLARVDGKSPVEYIAREDERDLVRGVALPLIVQPPERLGAPARMSPALEGARSRMTATAIAAVHARRVWDSRGRPTLEAEVAAGRRRASGRAIAPAGAPRARGEAVDLRDGGEPFGGYDVHARGRARRRRDRPRAYRHGRRRPGRARRRLIELDGTPNKARLGGNAMRRDLDGGDARSGGRARASRCGDISRPRAVRIPVPEIQIFGGGAHAGAARRRPGLHGDLSDRVVVREALDRTAEVYRAAGQLLGERGLLQGVADEGGFWPAFASNEEALDMLVRAIERAGYHAGRRGVDLARYRGIRVRRGRSLQAGARRPRTRHARA